MSDIVKLIALAAKESGRLVTDALGDYRGSALPLDEREVLSPQVLTRFFNDGATGVLPEAVQVTGVSRRDVASVSSNCQTFVLDLEYRRGRQGPHSVFLKVPMRSLATRWFLGVTNSWRLETHVFRQLAPKLPIRTPVTYAAQAKGARFFVLQENLRDDDAVTLFTNLDMLEGEREGKD